MNYERENIRRMAGYQWGEQPLDQRTIKLNTNENPYPPAPGVQNALAGFDVIVSIEVVEHLPPETAPDFWSRVRGMCRPGGLVVLTTPNYRSHWPVIERILSRVGPVDYTEQHVNRYDRPRLTAELEATGLQVRTARTFFVIAPFLAAISSRLARRVDGLERR